MVSRYLISHECVDCAAHELDIGLLESADVDTAGQWEVSWSIVDCDPQQEASDSDSEQASSSSAFESASEAVLTSYEMSLALAVEHATTSVAAAAESEEALRTAQLDRELSTGSTSFRRLASITELSDSGNFAEMLPSAEWLQAAVMGSETVSTSSQQDGFGNHGKSSRRQLIAHDGSKSRRHLSLRGLLNSAASERLSQAQESEELPSAAWQVAAQAAAATS